MTTITFDTHRFIRKLRDAGFEERQAEAVAEAFQDASGEAELATRRDVDALRADLREMKVEINGKLTLVQWMLALVVAAEAVPFLAQVFR